MRAPIIVHVLCKHSPISGLSLVDWVMGGERPITLLTKEGSAIGQILYTEIVQIQNNNTQKIKQKFRP